jgi:DNA-binding protein HU-beta
MNKRDLIDAISGRLGDKKTATEAVNAVLDTIQSTVAKGDKVAITGFGVFEKAERPARTARNPATGASIKVPKSSVPKFRAGADFKALVNGDKKKLAAAGKK